MYIKWYYFTKTIGILDIFHSAEDFWFSAVSPSSERKQVFTHQCFQ